MSDNKDMASPAAQDRATDAPHGAPDGSPPFGSVSTDAGESPQPQPTPGPWETVAIPHYAVSDHTVTVTSEDVHHYAIRYQWRDEQDRRCTRFVAEVHKTYGHESECEPNARLIAAAPELLNELEVRDSDLVMLRRAIEEGDPRTELFVRIDDMLRETRAAIRKARGHD